MPAQANSTLALIARNKIPYIIFPWHENQPRRIFSVRIAPPTCHTRMRARRKNTAGPRDYLLALFHSVKWFRALFVLPVEYTKKT